MKMPTDVVKSLLDHVVRTIDHWWVETTNLKRGYFTRSNTNNSFVTYKDYVEWRYSTMKDCKDYVSIFISLEYEDSTDYIRITLRKINNGVYTEYDPFCEIHDGKVDVTISDDTGGYDEWFSIFGKGCFNDLTDNVATTVYRFMTDRSYDEGEVCADMDDVSKTLPAGLTTKEIFVLDENFFKSGDIYLLHISPKFHGDIHNGTALAPNAHLPERVYAICSDTNGGTVIEFMFKPKEPLVGIDDLVWIQVHAEDIENGLITVERVLTNEF